MEQLRAIEGTGEEISRYAGEHPKDRFLLVTVSRSASHASFDRRKWDQTLARIASYRGKFPVLPDEAYSTDALYE